MSDVGENSGLQEVAPAEPVACIPLVTCCSCHRNRPVLECLKCCGNTYRCKSCHALRARLTRALVGEAADVQQTIKALDPKSKADLMIQAEGLFGVALKAKVEEVAVLSRVSRTSPSVSAAGMWLDKQQLEDKYKDRPDQLASLLEKANTLTHPTRGVTLYEDVEISTLKKE